MVLVEIIKLIIDKNRTFHQLRNAQSPGTRLVSYTALDICKLIIGIIRRNTAFIIAVNNFHHTLRCRQ